MPFIHGPSDLLPRALRDISAQLLPRLRLIPEFRCWLPSVDSTSLGDNLTCMWSNSVLGGKKTSQTSILWQTLSQGVPLIILLDLLGSKTGGGSLVGFGQRIGNGDGNGCDKNERELNVTLIEEFLRRVGILEVQGQLKYGEVFRVEEFLDGSCSGFIKVLKTVQRVLDSLEATYPNLYELPIAADRRKEDLFERFFDLESLCLEDLRDMKEYVTIMIEEKSIVQEYLAVPLERMILFQEHIISRLHSVSSRSTDSIQWNRLFGMKENMYILGAGAYQSYCSQFHALVDIIDAVRINDLDDELLNERCLELSRQLTLPIDHILSLIETCSTALGITHPVENPNIFKSLCTAYQNLLNLKNDLSEIMRSKRTAYAKRYISKQTPNARINLDSCWELAEFVLDDCVCAQSSSRMRTRRFSSREKTSLSSSSRSSKKNEQDTEDRNEHPTELLSSSRRYRKTGQDTEIENENPNNFPGTKEDDIHTDVGTYVFAFLFEKILLLGRPILDSDSEEENLVDAPSGIPYPFHENDKDNLRSESAREGSSGGYEEWPGDLGPAIRSGTPFDVLCMISLAEIVEVEWLGCGDKDLAISVTWAKSHGTGNGANGHTSNVDSNSNTLLLAFRDRKQLQQWIRVLSHLAPSDTMSVDISECEDCDGNCLGEEGANSIAWPDELEFSQGRTGSKPRPWSLIARRKEALSSSLYLTLSDNESGHSFYSALSSPRSGYYSRSVRDLPASPPRSISSVFSSRPASLVAEPAKLIEAIQSIEGALPVIEEDEDDEDEDDDEPPDLTGQVRRIGNYPSAHGGFSDVWKCNWISGTQCHKVAVKVLRGKLLDAEREDKMAKRLEHEIKMWKRLDHENIVPLYGTCSDFGRYLSLVCPWYENGSLYQYVRKNDDVLKLPERLQLLSDIAAGLAYLHSHSIVHGDLSSANILINDNGRACLCDFGLSTLVEDLVDSWYPSSMLGGAIRWSAPELYCASYFEHAPPARPRFSVSSDIYSFGSITLETLSGKVPYHHLKHDGQVLIQLSKKVKPERTPSPFLTNDLWDLIRECWDDNPGARPSTVHVSSRLGLLRQRTAARHSI